MKTALDLRAVATLVVLCGSWGLNQVAMKVTLEGIPPALQMGARSALAALLVFLWCRLRGRPLFERDGSLWPGLATGVLFSAEFLLIFAGLSYTTAARAVIFIYLTPFIVAIGGHFLLGEPLGPRKLVGLCSAFCGLALAFFDGLSQTAGTTRLGDVLCIASAFLWGAATLIIKGSVLRQVSAEKTLLYQLAVSAVVGLALSVAIGETVVPRLALAVAPAFLYQAVWVAAITYVAWFVLMRDYPASLLSSFTFLTPLFGVGFGAALLGDPLSARFVAGLALVAAGIYLVNRSGGRARGALPGA